MNIAPKKDDEKYYIYKTTNLINGKYYVGFHKTSDPFDNYLGSGVRLIDAIKKYGVENFKKEILFEFDTQEEAEAKEPLPPLPFPPPLGELKMELNGLASPKMAVMFSLPKIFSAPDVIAPAIGAIAFFILSERAVAISVSFPNKPRFFVAVPPL